MPSPCGWLRNEVGDKMRRRETVNLRKENTPPNLWPYLRKWRLSNKYKWGNIPARYSKNQI